MSESTLISVFPPRFEDTIDIEGKPSLMCTSVGYMFHYARVFYNSALFTNMF